jgi:hypothetical protein
MSSATSTAGGYRPVIGGVRQQTGEARRPACGIVIRLRCCGALYVVSAQQKNPALADCLVSVSAEVA